ncbi:photoreceptor disk component PRCD [Desmodus rotundus]|uniref:photoreceptor disk component PRCD n=1 Tax=Desmodus rotundus TaxID=9430 RepID=UPI002380D96D|nr:photoreceptor disk component PRCD [Desmodus rotundus]XP_045046080.2 photoreceptor disk component PRCD [Desmodus rotundus]XP_053786726.1 photoreceptor disk component PRCD [Desmodus rotundus]
MCRSVSPVLASALPFAAEGTHSEVFGEDGPEGGTERLARPSLIILLASSSAAPPLGHLHPAAPQLPGISDARHWLRRAGRGHLGLLLRTPSGRGWGGRAMCTTLLLLGTLAVLCRRRFANRVQPEPSEVQVDGAVAGSSVDPDPQSSGRKTAPLGEALTSPG